MAVYNCDTDYGGIKCGMHCPDRPGDGLVSDGLYVVNYRLHQWQWPQSPGDGLVVERLRPVVRLDHAVVEREVLGRPAWFKRRGPPRPPEMIRAICWRAVHVSPRGQ